MEKFDEGDLEEAREFSIYCNLILQVRAGFQMTENQKIRFRHLILDFLNSTVEELNVLRSERSNRVERFLKVRMRTSFFDFFIFMAEIFCRIDLTDPPYSTDNLLRWVCIKIFT